MTQGKNTESGGTYSGSGGVGLDPIGMPRFADICREKEGYMHYTELHNWFIVVHPI